MRDTLFTAVLAFAVLVGGTLAIGSELLSAARPAKAASAPATAEVLVMPTVTVVGRAVAPAASTTLARAEASSSPTRVE